MGLDEVRDRIDFLKYAIDYIEKRISLVDNKASCLIAIQGGFFALVIYGMGKMFPEGCGFWSRFLSDLNIAVGFGITALTTLLLLGTLRPTIWLLGFWVEPETLGVEHPFLWPTKTFPKSGKEYERAATELDLEKIEKNCRSRHYVCLQLLRRKYSYYRWAIMLIKILVLWSIVGLAMGFSLRLFDMILRLVVG